jgi:ELWxxDGT repeat protein
VAHPLKTIVAPFFALALARAISAQPAYLVKDINRQPPDASQQPAWFSGFVGADDQLLFGAYDPHDGFALWTTRGTPSSTRLVKSASDIQYPSDFIVFDNFTFFIAYDSGGNSWVLWKSDGTTLGTTLVERFDSNGGIVPGSLVVLNGGLYFAGGDETQGRGIWKTDGTTEGTVLVNSLSGGIGTFVVFRDELFFFRGTEDGQVGLWRSDGTDSGTQVVKALPIPSDGESPYALTASGQNVYFFLFDDGPKYRLWKSDGTDAGTIPVREFAADTYEISLGQFPYFGPDQPLDVGGNLFFAANDGVHGRAVWSTDGTVPGTSMRSDGVALPTNEGPVLVGSVRNSVLFFTSDEGGPAHLWKTSGSTAAAALKDFIAAPIFSFETTIVEAGGAVYFWAEDQEHGVELWRSDATAVGTALVADIVPGPGSSDAYPLAAKSGNVFFSVSLGPDAPSIWKVDTQGNTTLLRLFRAEN